VTVCLTRARAAVLAFVLVSVTSCTSADTDTDAGADTDPIPSGSCVVAAAGDVAGEDDYRTGAARTADLISSAEPEKVLALGDLVYPEGTASGFADLYDPTWGAFKDITAPTPGNHEYQSEGKGYYDYFDVAPDYAFDVCGWHVVSVDQYASRSSAIDFIEEEGAAAGDSPLMVFWHEPRYSSGEHGTNPDLQPLWEAAVEAGADVVLNGHDHHYERFEPLDADGEPASDGTVEFVSGGGGHHPRELGGDREPYSAVAVTGTPGVLFLTLRTDGFDWSWRDVEGRTGDSGSRRLP
jgi:hypothetical protein